MKKAGATQYNAPATLPLIPELEPHYDRTVSQNYLEAVEKFGQDKFMGYRAGLSTHSSQISESYRYITYLESAKYVQSIVKQLETLGIKKGDRIGIYGKNSPLWLLADIAAAFCDALVVPIYDTLGVDNIHYCMNYVGARFIFVGSEYLANILGMANSIPSLEHILLFDNFLDEARIVETSQKVFLKMDNKDINLDDDTLSLFQLSQNSKQTLDERESDNLAVPEVVQFVYEMLSKKQVGRLHMHVVDTDVSHTEVHLKEVSGQKDTDPAAIIFTSGTSGRPKAVVASFRNLYAGGICMGRRLQPYNRADSGIQSSTISYLPLAHVFERGFEHYCYCRGYCINYYSGSVKNLSQDIKLAKPTIIIGVPRVYAKIYQGVMAQLKKSSVLVRGIFNMFYNGKRNYMAKHPETFRTGRVPFYDIIFKKVSENLGGNMEVLVTASSALPDDVLWFLKTCTGARLMHGYGSTETSATGLVICSGEALPTPSALGHACQDTEVVLIDRSDASEYSLEKDNIGEILIKGPGVCLGYMNSDVTDLSPLVDEQGYYHTGDLGLLHADKSVSFVRRISLVQKLQHGEFVDLDQLESSIEASPLVLQCFAYADPSKCSPVCVCSVDSTVLKQKMGVQQLNRKEVEALLLQEISTFVRKTMKAYCVPKAVRVVYDKDWSLDSDLYTPSQKKQHRNFRTRFSKELREMLETIE